MTYTESNHSFVYSILKKYFQEAGIVVQDSTLNEIVERVCRDEDFKNLSAANGHDLILQQGLNMLKKVHEENKS